MNTNLAVQLLVSEYMVYRFIAKNRGIEGIEGVKRGRGEKRDNVV